jgi:transcriptional regulator with XRE-family HTH domain
MSDRRGVGKAIRVARLQQRLTLREVAEKAGITTSALSQLERDKFNPTIGTLKAIAAALHVTLGTFFPLPESTDRVMVRPRERKILSPRRGITYQLLTPNLSGQIEFILSVYEVGASSGDEPLAYAAEQCGLVLQGTVDVHLGDEIYRLTAGDSIRFDCLVPHRIVNAGRTKLHCIWAITPPAF